MANRDTIELLKECSSGVKAGVTNLNELAVKTKSPALKKILTQSITNHESLSCQAVKLLGSSAETAKEPSMMMKGISRMKTSAMLAMDDSDSTIAGLVTDGCGMGIKSVTQSLNDCTRASAEAKAIAEQIIAEEKNLSEAVAKYL